MKLLIKAYVHDDVVSDPGCARTLCAGITL